MADGEPADGARFAPCPAIAGGFAAMTYREVQASTGILPFGLRHYWKGHFVRDLDALGDRRPSARPCATSPAATRSCCSRRSAARPAQEPTRRRGLRHSASARWNVSALGVWEDPADDDAQIAWARRAAEALRPASLTGGRIRQLRRRPTRPANGIRAGYGRMATITRASARAKRRYDPDNVFRFNNNIPPAEA